MNIISMQTTFYKQTILVSIAILIIMCIPIASQIEKGGAIVKDDVISQNKLLVIRLRSPKNDYKIDETLELEATIQNISGSKIFIYNLMDWGESSSYSLWIKDSKTGKNVGGVMPSSPPPPPPSSERSFIRLSPNFIYGIASKWTFKELHIMKPGTYIIEVAYHSPCSQKFSFGLPIWSKEMGSIKANTIEIRVR